MLRLAGLLLLVGAVSVDANRCRFREATGRAPDTIRRPRVCRGSGSFIGDDYWTSISYDGQIRDGRSRADFLIFDQISDGYIAYWITRTKYGQTHYEAFGHAHVRPDGKICAWFVGLHKEIVEVCGGFRILSRNRYNPSEPIPFEWVLANPMTGSRDTLGFHQHRIAKYSWEGDNFYGDAKVQDKNFQGVSPASENFVEVTNAFDFERKVWLLRRKNEVATPQPIYKTPTPPIEDPNFYKYADPHTEERIYQVQQSRDSFRPYAGGDQQQDPRYYDPRYRNQLNNLPSWRRTEQESRERARLYQTQASSSQDRLSVPGFPYSDGQQQPAARVPGDSDGWHVVGDNTGATVGEGAAPSEGQKSPAASDVKDGYYTDSYGRQVPIGGAFGRPVDTGAEPAHRVGSGAHPEGQEPVSTSQGAGEAPSGHTDVQTGHYTDHYGRERPVQGQQEQQAGSQSSQEIGQGVHPGGHLARLHRPTIVKDEYGTIYKQVTIDGQVHYIPDPDAAQPVRPDPRIASIPRGQDVDAEQWRRQQEHMRIAEEERRIQEQAVRDRWNQAPERKEEEPVHYFPELPQRTGEEEQPLEKDEEVEEEPLVKAEKLPPPRPAVEEPEDDEDDS